MVVSWQLVTDLMEQLAALAHTSDGFLRTEIRVRVAHAQQALADQVEAASIDTLRTWVAHCTPWISQR